MGTTTADVMTTIRSLDEFYAATYARLVAVLTVTAGSRVEAEEVVQEAFVRLVPRWSTSRATTIPSSGSGRWRGGSRRLAGDA
jgi:DNA-directed RNA polymerase specialized sigma24 family protein